MKYLCAIFDRKTQTYERVLEVQHVAELQREFADIKKDPTTKYGKHPSDFELYQIGEFNPQSGLIAPITHIQIGG